MAKKERTESLFWIGIALAICVESIRLGPGTISSPGPGFVPLGCGAILGVTALVFFLQARTRPLEGGERLWQKGARWGILIIIPLSLIGYALLLKPLGFLIVSFFWMGFVCMGLGKMGWKGAVLTSALSTFASYIVFQYYLGILFPPGLFRF